jgi:hypothetical protein
VVDLRTNRVALDVLDHGEVALALDVQGQDRVGVTGGHHGRVARKDDVDGVFPVAVNDGGNLALAADAAGCALAEFVAVFRGDLRTISHAESPFVSERF